MEEGPLDDGIRPRKRRGLSPHARQRLQNVVLIAGPLLLAGTILAVRSYERFERKSRQSEAKTNLSGLFTAQKAFFGEYMTYTTDLVSLAWGPDGEPRYLYGFCNEFPPTSGGIPGITGFDGRRSDTSLDGIAPTYWNGSEWARGSYSRALTESIGPPCAALATMQLDRVFRVTGQIFVAFAIGEIDGDPELEVWAIDQNKNLRLVVPD